MAQPPRDEERLRPVIFDAKTDEIETLFAMEDQPNQGRYFYVVWRHGWFKNGFYNSKVLGQTDPAALGRKYDNDKDWQKDLTATLSSKFPKSTTDVDDACEWKCGDHETEGVHIRSIKDHVIPQRYFDRVGLVILV